MGRFLTPDPYKATATSPSNPANPQSWNRYAYVQNDPVNFRDPRGLFLCADCGDGDDEEPEDPHENDDRPMPGPYINPKTPETLVVLALQKLPKARELALKYLDNPDCKNWLGGGGALDPATVLKGLLGGTEYGSIDFTNNWIGAAAKTDASLLDLSLSATIRNGQLTYNRVSIQIYTGRQDTGMCNMRTPRGDAEILLHELGHALNLLDPTKNHGIQNNDFAKAIQDQNHAGLEEHCLQ